MGRALSVVFFLLLAGALLVRPPADPVRVSALRVSELLAAEVLRPDGQASTLADALLDGPAVGRDAEGRLQLRLGGVRMASDAFPSGDLLVHGLARRTLVSGLRQTAYERGETLQVEGELSPVRDGLQVLVVLGEDVFSLHADAPDGSSLSVALEGWRPPGRGALFPPLVAILLAVLFRRPVLALFAGVWTATFLVRLGAPGAGVAGALVGGLPDVATNLFWPQLVDPYRLQIMGFVVAMLGMVGVMTRSGGLRGLMDVVARLARNARRTQVATWLMGLVVFFDDYANCILVGTTMRPLSDRYRIAREKLAYLVDSTAAPVAGLSIFSTWIAFEVSTFSAQLPAAGLLPSEGYAVFVETLPFRFYCVLALILSGLIAFSGRDFGPMLAAERRARSTGHLVRVGGRPMVKDAATHLEPAAGITPRAHRALLPVLTFVGMTMFEIVRVGLSAVDSELLSLRALGELMRAGDSTRALLIGSGSGLLVACITASRSHRSRQGLQMLGLAALGLASGWVATLGLDALAALCSRHAEVLRWPLLGGLHVDLAELTAQCASPAFRHAIALAVANVVVLAVPSPQRGQVVLAAWTTLRSMGIAVAILYLAWMIGAACDTLGTAPYLTGLLSDHLPPELLPSILFLTAAVVAFATGSSWSTMSILLPLVVGLAYNLGQTSELGGHLLMVMSIGAVLEGSIFGDHCSPLSDTTVLSSTASASDHIDHVRTQIPYALTAMVVALGVGYIPCAFMGHHPTISLALAAGLILMIVLVVGRKSDAAAPGAAPAP